MLITIAIVVGTAIIMTVIHTWLITMIFRRKRRLYEANVSAQVTWMRLYFDVIDRVNQTILDEYSTKDEIVEQLTSNLQFLDVLRLDVEDEDDGFFGI